MWENGGTNNTIPTKSIPESEEEIKRHNDAKVLRKVFPVRCPYEKSADQPCHVTGAGKPVRTGVKLSSNKKAEPVWVQQMCCKTHGKFRVIPPFLLPKKHYVAPVVEDAVQAGVAGMKPEAFCSRWDSPDPLTVRRWLRALAGRLNEAVLRAKRLMSEILPEWVSERSLPEGGAWSMAQVWSFLGEVQDACLVNFLPVPFRVCIAW